jgi:hypothetical protein
MAQNPRSKNMLHGRTQVLIVYQVLYSQVLTKCSLSRFPGSQPVSFTGKDIAKLEMREYVWPSSARDHV